ncbi:hypothetical protein WDW86_22055 [Bdellovibrionota bacterium FG-2]
MAQMLRLYQLDAAYLINTINPGSLPFNAIKSNIAPPPVDTKSN